MFQDVAQREELKFVLRGRVTQISYTPVHLSSKKNQIISYSKKNRGRIQVVFLRAILELLWAIEEIELEKLAEIPLSRICFEKLGVQ